MNLTIKTLKGAKFNVEAEASNTVGEVKTIIVSSVKHLPEVKQNGLVERILINKPLALPLQFFRRQAKLSFLQLI